MPNINVRFLQFGSKWSNVVQRVAKNDQRAYRRKFFKVCQQSSGFQFSIRVLVPVTVLFKNTTRKSNFGPETN